MEYIDGSSLSQLLSVAADYGVLVPIEVACAIMHDVLLGLEHAHTSGVIHCDISPQNILVGGDGLSRILDFGIAKVASSARESRRDMDNTEIRGKVPYMAPEQLRGIPIDHRVDLYAAGATLWELLTGVRMFRGTNRMQIAASVLTGQVEPPSRHLVEVPRSLDALLLKATSRDPHLRFRSAREMANALASSVPLASREDVVATMRRLDLKSTPTSGIRQLTAEEMAVRKNARAVRAAEQARVALALAPAAALVPVPIQDPDDARCEQQRAVDAKRTTMSEAHRGEARASLRVRLLTVGLLGIALGAGQATFNVLPIDTYIDRWFSNVGATAATPKPKPAATTAPTPAAPPAMPSSGSSASSAPSASSPRVAPTMQAPSSPMLGTMTLPTSPSADPSAKPRSEKPRGARSDKPRR
jgi:serine/threonine-protein kinase